MCSTEFTAPKVALNVVSATSDSCLASPELAFRTTDTESSKEHQLTDAGPGWLFVTSPTPARSGRMNQHVSQPLQCTNCINSWAKLVRLAANGRSDLAARLARKARRLQNRTTYLNRD